uniref:Uncharacterized protein n=1 Tax=Arundo donax TaxID=35708 RepID=A0A0A9HDH2_ARUDO
MIGSSLNIYIKESAKSLKMSSCQNYDRLGNHRFRNCLRLCSILDQQRIFTTGANKKNGTDC